MPMSHVELYEALKGCGITEDAARLIADVVPPAKDLATRVDIFILKSDVIAVDAKIDRVDAKIDLIEARLEARIEAASSKTIRWILGVFIPVWATTWGVLAVALLRG